ncbi:GNAT family N-acetyltransferase [Paenibacillus nanensis]|uniref:GNAT family N-acetyltransferase n=1 Tax=Paenibacillus nanensis TaxID=393251 RepID=A0A3A1UNE3_9BACL|nr:GNAT family N-acetyltransferase [Paenibacillus nanensis]RIX49336.1 GNAT family N-acetyltransferase [Paenibacillus nanensis]
MTTNSPSIAVANAPDEQQLESIFTILDEVFSVGKAFFQDRLLKDSSYDPQTTWYASVDGQIASTVQIFPLRIRVGQAELKIGGIGSVGTDPNYRGMGLAHRILHAQCEWMKRNDYDATLLLAVIHAFYEKAGWKLIPEKAYSIAKPALIEPSEGFDIIPFEPQHLQKLRSIYEQFNDKRTYTLIRDKAYWDDLLSWPAWYQADCRLLRHNGRIVAYGLIEKTEGEKPFIQELAYLPEAADEAAALFTALCQLPPNATHVLAKWPDDHKLADYYKQHHAEQFELNVSMWKMIDCRSMFRKLQPELEQRIHHSEFAHLPLHLELHIGVNRLWLHYRNQRLSISGQPDPGAAYVTLRLDPYRLISSVIFGYQPAEEDEADEAASKLLQVLFPKQQAVFYLTDKF